jgi:hypothetical protein
LFGKEIETMDETILQINRNDVQIHSKHSSWMKFTTKLECVHIGMKHDH